MTQPTPPPDQPAEPASVCRDKDCPVCQYPETYTELDIKTTPPTVLAVGCRRCGWRDDGTGQAAALSLQGLVGLLYRLADRLAAVGPDAPDCLVDTDWATQVLAYVPWLESLEITRDDVLRVLACPMEHLSPATINSVADAVMALVRDHCAVTVAHLHPIESHDAMQHDDCRECGTAWGGPGSADPPADGGSA